MLSLHKGTEETWTSSLVFTFSSYLLLLLFLSFSRGISLHLTAHCLRSLPFFSLLLPSFLPVSDRANNTSEVWWSIALKAPQSQVFISASAGSHSLSQFTSTHTHIHKQLH